MKLSVLLLGLAISMGSIASPVAAEEHAQRHTYDVEECPAKEVAKRYVGMAHALDVRMRKEAALRGVAQRYIRFLEQFGTRNIGDIKELMESLFASDCRKVINGKAIAHTMEELYTQMANAKEAVGLWSVEVVNPVTVNTDTNTVVIHYKISTQEVGTFVVMKFLSVENGFITEINEVYNMLDHVADNLQQITD